MKNYILFAFDDYYPRGGANDIEGLFDSIEEAKASVERNAKLDRYQIYDVEANLFVLTGTTDWFDDPKVFWKEVA